MVNYDKVNRNFREISSIISRFLNNPRSTKPMTMRCVNDISNLCTLTFKELGYRVEPNFLESKDMISLSKNKKLTEIIEYRDNLFDIVISECNRIGNEIPVILRKFPKRNNGILINTYSNSNARIELAIMSFYEKIGYTS